MFPIFREIIFFLAFFCPNQSLLAKPKAELQDVKDLLGFPNLHLLQGGKKKAVFLLPNCWFVLIGRDHLKSLQDPGKSGDFWGMPQIKKKN